MIINQEALIKPPLPVIQAAHPEAQVQLEAAPAIERVIQDFAGIKTVTFHTLIPDGRILAVGGEPATTGEDRLVKPQVGIGDIDGEQNGYELQLASAPNVVDHFQSERGNFVVVTGNQTSVNRLDDESKTAPIVSLVPSFSVSIDRINGHMYGLSNDSERVILQRFNLPDLEEGKTVPDTLGTIDLPDAEGLTFLLVPGHTVQVIGDRILITSYTHASDGNTFLAYNALTALQMQPNGEVTQQFSTRLTDGNQDGISPVKMSAQGIPLISRLYEAGGVRTLETLEVSTDGVRSINRRDVTEFLGRRPGKLLTLPDTDDVIFYTYNEIVTFKPNGEVIRTPRTVSESIPGQGSPGTTDFDPVALNSETFVSRQQNGDLRLVTLPDGKIETIPGGPRIYFPRLIVGKKSK